MNEANLFFKGVTPFSHGKAISFKEYIMLYEILMVFHRKIREFGLKLTANSYSIPGLAFKTFRNNYMEMGMLVNLSLNKSIDDFIREGYYGGRCEVFMGYIGNQQGY